MSWTPLKPICLGYLPNINITIWSQFLRYVPPLPPPHPPHTYTHQKYWLRAYVKCMIWTQMINMVFSNPINLWFFTLKNYECNTRQHLIVKNTVTVFVKKHNKHSNTTSWVIITSHDVSDVQLCQACRSLLWSVVRFFLCCFLRRGGSALVVRMRFTLSSIRRTTSTSIFWQRLSWSSCFLNSGTTWWHSDCSFYSFAVSMAESLTEQC